MDLYRAFEIADSSSSLAEMMVRLNAEDVDLSIIDACEDRFWNIRSREKRIPVFSQFELTPLCNLDCKMCYVHLRSNQLGDKNILSADQWETIMQQAVDAGLLFASLSGGECLTHPEFDRIYLFLFRKGVRISVLTNGLLLDENRISFFKKYPPRNIQITLYGHNDDVYERVTGRRVFNQVIDNIQMARNAGLPVTLAITPSKYLGKDDEDLLRFVHSFGLPYSINDCLFSPREETERSNDFHGITFADYFRLMKLKNSLDGYQAAPAKLCELPKVGGDTCEKVKGLRCSAGRGGYDVLWDGKMKACLNLHTPAIDLLDVDFDKAWDFVKQTSEDYLLPIECEGCSYQKISLKCVGHHFEGAKPGHASPQMCEYCKEAVKTGFKKLD